MKNADFWYYKNCNSVISAHILTSMLTHVAHVLAIWRPWKGARFRILYYSYKLLGLQRRINFSKFGGSKNLFEESIILNQKYWKLIILLIATNTDLKADLF